MRPGHKKTTGLTVKQRKYVKGVANGLQRNYACEQAGYAPGTSSAAIESQAVKNALIESFRRRGLTEDRIALKLEQGLEANQYHYFSKDGIVTDQRESPDASTRHKYLQSWLEVNKYIKNNTIENLNIGIVTMPDESSTEKWSNPIDTGTLPTENEKP